MRVLIVLSAALTVQIAFAMDDIFTPFSPYGWPNPELAYQDEVIPEGKRHCAGHVHAAGLDLHRWLSFTPAQLHAASGDGHFRLEVGACYTDGKCRRLAGVDFSGAALNSQVLNLWLLDLGCHGKVSNRLQGIKIELVRVRPWYAWNRSLGANYLTVADLLNLPSRVDFRDTDGLSKIKVELN